MRPENSLTHLIWCDMHTKFFTVYVHYQDITFTSYIHNISDITCTIPSEPTWSQGSSDRQDQCNAIAWSAPSSPNGIISEYQIIFMDYKYLQVPTYSATRWWSKWEVMNHLLKSFGDVCSFLQNDELPPSKLKLLEILNDSPKNRKLQMELAMTIDAGEPFVKTTYRLEGDGPLIFSAYEEINALTASISTQFYPNTIAVARKLSSNPVQQQQLIDYSKSCVQPAYSYFNVKFGHDLKQTVDMLGSLTQQRSLN